MVSLVVAAAFFVEIAVRFLPASYEAELLDGWVAADAFPTVSDPRQGAAAALLERLAAHWPENPYAFRVGVVADGEPNAFALPGGMILLTRGLLDGVESENELAFVLGHELGHFRNRDHLRSLGRGLLVSLVLQSIGLGGDVELPAALAQIAESGFGRDQESDADRFGLTLVHAEYGHVAGAADFFEVLPDAGRDGVASQLASYFSTHPLSEARVDALERVALAERWRRVGELTPAPGAGAR